MNWYKKQIIAQSLNQLLTTLNPQPNITQFLHSLPKNILPFYVNELRKQPNISLQQLQNNVTMPKKQQRNLQLPINLEPIRKKIPNLIQRYFSNLDQKQAINILSQLVEADPTNGKYIEWITRQYIAKTIIVPEDNYKIIEDLTKFEKLKNKLPN